MKTRLLASSLAFVTVGMGALIALTGAARSTDPGSCLQADDANFASIGGGCKDLRTGRVWSGQMYGLGTWPYAKDYCSNLVEGGQSDWRLPTKDELVTLHNDGGASYVNIWPTASIWSSTGAKGGGYYTVVISTGFVGSATRSSGMGVACVR